MSRIRYSQIKNLSDLRHERMRVNLELDYAKRRINDDYAHIDQFFSLEYIVGMISNRWENLHSLANSALTGYELVKTLINRLRK